jgi:hypothetical protein
MLPGVTPLANVIFARLLIDGSLQGIAQGTIQLLVLPVVLPLGVNLSIFSPMSRTSLRLPILLL